jgi:hypothetical protein
MVEVPTIVWNNRGRPPSNADGVDAAVPEWIVYCDQGPWSSVHPIAEAEND